MPSRTETFSILCPLCGEQHDYRLEVKASPVMTWTLAPGMEMDAILTFTRLLNCAQGKGTFQVPIVVTESHDERISDVVVKDSSNGGQE